MKMLPLLLAGLALVLAPAALAQTQYYYSPDNDPTSGSTNAIPFGVVHSDDRYHVNLFTIGASYKPDDKTIIAIQHLFGRASGENVYLHSDHEVHFDYFSAGVERRVAVSEEFVLALRAGVDRGGLTCGLGCTLPHGLRVDYAFMSGYGYDVRNEFGTATLHMIGVGKSF